MNGGETFFLQREEPGRKQMSSEAYKTEKNVADFYIWK